MMLTSILMGTIIVSGAKIVSIIANSGKDLNNNTGSYDDSDYTEYDSSDSIVYNKEDEIHYTKETYDYSRSYDDSDYTEYDSSDNIVYNKEDEIEDKVDYAQETYDYLNKLTMDEIYEYVQYNDTLSYYDYKIYGTCNRDDKYYVLKHICDIAEREGRSFTNKYSRY